MPNTSSNTSFSSLPKVRIEDAELPNALAEALGPCWVESSVNLPAAFHLTFRDPTRLLVRDFPEFLRIGARVAVYAVASGRGKKIPVVTGLVTGIETEYYHGRSTTVLRGLDHAFKMLRHRRATGYRNMTAAEIVTQLAGRDGVEVGIIEPTTPQYELITQPNISDWQFVQYLADSSDMEADFDDRGKLRFRKAKPATIGAVAGNALQDPRVLEFDANMLRCRTGVTASDQVSEVRSRGWNADEKRLMVATAYARTSPGLQIGETPEDVVSAFGWVRLTETGTPYGTEAQTKRAADSLTADITSAFAELEIEVKGRPDLAAGVVVAFKGAGPPFDGTYTVTTTRHVFDEANGYTTWVWVTGRQVRTLYGLAAGGDRAAPRIHGVANAIVDDINDPKQQGRVKLRFPWFDDNYKTDWVRTVQFGGHKGGGVISPEVEDEVLVAFDRGALDYPYVIGGLYSNEDDSPSDHENIPLQTGGRLNRRSLVSRTGQRLEILDAEGQTGVRLRSGDKKLTVFLAQSKTTITITSDGAIDIKGETTVTVSSTDQLNLKARKVTISDALTIEGDTSMHGAVSINGAVSIEGALRQTGVVNVTGDVNVTGIENVFGSLLQNGTLVV
jgi:uncharacterized protein involved in type VI secretion and phage assembly